MLYDFLPVTIRIILRHCKNVSRINNWYNSLINCILYNALLTNCSKLQTCMNLLKFQLHEIEGLCVWWVAFSVCLVSAVCQECNILVLKFYNGKNVMARKGWKKNEKKDITTEMYQQDSGLLNYKKCIFTLLYISVKIT